MVDVTLPAPRGLEPSRRVVGPFVPMLGSNRRGATDEVGRAELASDLPAGTVPLGKNTRFTSPPPEGEGRDPLKEGDKLRSEARGRRFLMQAGARHLLPDQSRLQACLRCRRYGVKEIDIIHKPLTRSARFGGLIVCGSVWMCPVCAAKITEVRRVELGQAVRAWWAHEGAVVLVTYTLRHRRGDHLGELVSGLSKARGILTSGKGGQAIYRRHGVQGSIRALEVTHGENGWHPHIHELLFLAPGPVDCDRLVSDLRERWSYSVEKAGLRDVNDHGVDVRVSSGDIQEYVAKCGFEPWGVEHELTKQASKVSRSAKGASPMQLLAEFSTDGDYEAGCLFAEYARVMKGRRQLFWSKGLRARLLPEVEERSDEEIAADVDDMCEVHLARLSLPHWQRILHTESRAHVLNLASACDVEGLRRFFETIGIPGSVFGTPAPADGTRPKPQAGRVRPAEPGAGQIALPLQ